MPHGPGGHLNTILLQGGGTPPADIFKIRVGSVTPSKVYVGATQVLKIYVGSTVVWDDV